MFFNCKSTIFLIICFLSIKCRGAKLKANPADMWEYANRQLQLAISMYEKNSFNVIVEHPIEQDVCRVFPSHKRGFKFPKFEIARSYSNCQATVLDIVWNNSLAWGCADTVKGCDIQLTGSIRNILRKPKAINWIAAAKLSARYLGTRFLTDYGELELSLAKALSDNKEYVMQDNPLEIHKSLQINDVGVPLLIVGGLSCDTAIRSVQPFYQLSTVGFNASKNFNSVCERFNNCSASCTDWKNRNITGLDATWKEKAEFLRLECWEDVVAGKLWATTEPLEPCPLFEYHEHFFDKKVTMPLFHENGDVVKIRYMYALSEGK